jgi:RimJ/RimL family protein N-acetyltransferase
LGARAAPVLTTERLTLRPQRVADLEPIAAIHGDPATMRHISKQPQGREDSWRRVLAGAGLWTLLGYGYWVVERRSDRAVLGQLGWADFKRDMAPGIEGLPELGYMIAGYAQGQGYASEGVGAALAWADTELAADRFVAIISPDNAPSIRVIDKAGFKLVAPATHKGEPVLLYERPRRRA